MIRSTLQCLNSQTGGVRAVLNVPAFSLDDLSADLPPGDVLKNDVEGAEAEVLQGAVALLEACRPIVLCEVGQDTSAWVSAFLLPAAIDCSTQNERQPVEQLPWATVALPEERVPA